VSFLFFGFLYLPPLTFLFVFIRWKENFGLNTFGLGGVLNGRWQVRGLCVLEL
jgi:hypothetical protein